jgi:hypothetical protein
MEPEYPIPCSQEPVTDPYPEPDKSSPYLPPPISLRPVLTLSDPVRQEDFSFSSLLSCFFSVSSFLLSFITHILF